jgi:hypothetical protein
VKYINVRCTWSRTPLRFQVDPEDYERLARFAWRAFRDSRGNVYACRKMRGGYAVLMHRAILRAPRRKLVDHESRDTLDNRKRNLRICTKSENAINSKLHCDNASGFRGVYQSANGRTYYAQATVRGQTHHLGTYRTAREGARAHARHMLKHFGAFVPDYVRRLAR